jgi:hypothetical protein
MVHAMCHIMFVLAVHNLSHHAVALACRGSRAVTVAAAPLLMAW